LQIVIGENGKQRTYPFHSGSRDAWKAAMLKCFPKEEKALDKYLDLLKVSRAPGLYSRWGSN
jgi:hypothetical protein